LTLDEGSDSQTYEIWSIPQKSDPAKTFTKLPKSALNHASANGRIAWLTGSPHRVVVFDIDRGKVIFIDPPGKPRDGETDEGGVRKVEPREPAISRDGKTLLSLGDDLWDVDAGRLRWSMPAAVSTWLVSAKMERQSIDPGGRFEVHEQWSLFNGAKRSSYAVRSFETGVLLYRCWRPTVMPQAAVSSDGAVIFDDEVVRRLPPSVNCPVFALCQTILALPLLLLWAGLKWTAKRAARREPAVFREQQ
jgi:hypothetical protein